MPHCTPPVCLNTECTQPAKLNCPSELISLPLMGLASCLGIMLLFVVHKFSSGNGKIRELLRYSICTFKGFMLIAGSQEHIH